MTGLWIAMTLLAVAVGALIARPLMLPPKTAARRADYDLDVFRDQLQEVDNDAARGLLDDEAAEAARLEIQRRILAADDDIQTAGEAGYSPGDGRARVNRTAGWAAAIGVPMAALVLYLAQGSPNAPDQPYAARDIPQQSKVADNQPDPDIEDLVRRLVDRLKKTPEDVMGWMLLGRTMESLGRYDEARNALARARQLAPGRAEVEIAYAESVIMANGMRVNDEAAGILKSVHERAPYEPKARYYIGLMKAQRDDVAGALQDWVDLLALSSRDAPWIPLVRQQMNRAANELNVDPASLSPSASAQQLITARPAAAAPAAQSGVQPGPTREQVEAASEMSAEDRAQMIRGMVERLATRMKETPDDLAGWQRLERAYRVLGEPAKAAEAAAQIKRLSE